ncbi:phosphate ABC transporter substrate-binding protein [Candidatus Desantisbacteria bacterium]|nr:phosphate ABC transporter substrate-binding protein [Candidatus Desantisbacteria bacterium]
MFKKIYICIFLLLLPVVLFSGCGKKSENITLAGSTAFQPFAEKLAEEYMKKNAGVSINVQGGGSSMGIQSAISGVANIGMADMVALPPEANTLKQYVVARDGIVIIIHPSNTISNLTTQQAQKIFSGEITNWQEVGGENKKITIISREEGSGTRTSFHALLLQDIKLTSNALIQESNGTVRENVSSDPGAIGYISHGMVNEKVKVISLDGIEPTTENTRTGAYRLIRPIYLLTKSEPMGLAKSFIDYILSSDGQGIIESSGLFSAK